MTFKEFLQLEGLWDSDDKGTPYPRKPSDGQPFASQARGGKPQTGQAGTSPLMMKKKMKR